MACTGDLEFEEVGDECDCLEPFFFEETLAADAATAERWRREEAAAAAEKARKLEEFTRRRAVHQAVIDSIREYNPKKGEVCYTRYFLRDFSEFDIDEKSPLAPARYTDRTIGKEVYTYCNSVNILSVKIASSDVGFPIKVHGTIIARDALDYRCVFINSEDQCLILSGPTRGLVLIDNTYFEIDLKTKAEQKHEDKQLSKGLLWIDGILTDLDNEFKVKSETLESRLSTVEVKFATVRNAVEATLEIKVLEGVFYGEITACTTSIEDRIVLHDSKAGSLMASNGSGVTTQLWRRVVSVGLKETLLLTIVAQHCDDSGVCPRRTLVFNPSRFGSEEVGITCGDIKMLVKANWSVFE